MSVVVCPALPCAVCNGRGWFEFKTTWEVFFEIKKHEIETSETIVWIKEWSRERRAIRTRERACWCIGIAPWMHSGHWHGIWRCNGSCRLGNGSVSSLAVRRRVKTRVSDFQWELCNKLNHEPCTSMHLPVKGERVWVLKVFVCWASLG